MCLSDIALNSLAKENLGKSVIAEAHGGVANSIIGGGGTYLYIHVLHS